MALTIDKDDVPELDLTQEERLRLSQEIHAVLRDNVLWRLERLEKAMDKVDAILQNIHERLGETNE